MRQKIQVDIPYSTQRWLLKSEYEQPTLFDVVKDNKSYENPSFLTNQVMTYLGNKRGLLGFILEGVNIVKDKLNKDKLNIFDVFSGSGIVARFFKQHSNLLVTNDLERYSYVINECYLSNKSEINLSILQDIYCDLVSKNDLIEGIITKYYSPKYDENIQPDERVFYTHRNAMYIDTMRKKIDEIPQQYQKYFLAPLITEASIHSNTSGIFKGFHKNPKTKVGQFGGGGSDALTRIMGDINLPFPIFSNFECDVKVLNGDSNKVVNEVNEVDLAYLDPPYNQHPYGSNYFMLNLILENKEPKDISRISGIPNDWNRSNYNKKQYAYNSLKELISNIKAKFVLISFNSEGFISKEEMTSMLEKNGKLDILEKKYNTFRGCRNLNSRDIHVKEYLFLLEK